LRHFARVKRAAVFDAGFVFEQFGIVASKSIYKKNKSLKCVHKYVKILAIFSCYMCVAVLGMFTALLVVVLCSTDE
jgi:hypothetical protein